MFLKFWIKGKDKREKLRMKYCKLMKKAYEIAPKSKQKSDHFNKEAKKILKELHQLGIG